MANNFKPWVDAPISEQQVQSASAFAEDEQRINGFKAGDPASALRVNSALRQANVVVAGLMEFCDEVKTLPDNLSLLSTVTEVKDAIEDSIKTLHNTTLTSAKEYTDENIGELERGILYDQVVRTQAEFETLIASPTWLDAESVALVGQFVYDEPNNSGIKIPATVKQIHGFNSAKITITNFVYDATMTKGGLWYDTAPTTPDYSIRDLEVDCTGTDAIGFFNCTNLMNCTGTGTGTIGGWGFSGCTNLVNCTGTGTGAETNGCGFSYCTNLTNCTGTGEGINGFGFNSCISLTNCTGTGTGRILNGWGFYYINYASNCRDGGSSTAMWGSTNKNINVETCRKTLVTADNSELNT